MIKDGVNDVAVKRLAESKLFAESWNVAFRRKSVGSILSDTASEFTIIRNGFRFWAADPFVLEYEGRTYIFAELYDYLLRRGTLGYCEIRGNRATRWKTVIRENCHLSYPCLFQHDGRIFMMPESGNAQMLAVYESVSFPDEWQRCAELRKNVCLTDTTPFPSTGYRYALAHRTDQRNGTYLCLLDLTNAHKDVRIEGSPQCNRPAGYAFEWHGQMVRPAQVSERGDDGYGKGLVFYQCERSEDTAYREMEIRRIFPTDLRFDRKVLPDGMHTYNASGNYEVVDIKTRRFNVLNLIMRFVGKLCR